MSRDTWNRTDRTRGRDPSAQTSRLHLCSVWTCLNCQVPTLQTAFLLVFLTRVQWGSAACSCCGSLEPPCCPDCELGLLTSGRWCTNHKHLHNKINPLCIRKRARRFFKHVILTTEPSQVSPGGSFILVECVNKRWTRKWEPSVTKRKCQRSFLRPQLVVVKSSYHMRGNWATHCKTMYMISCLQEVTSMCRSEGPPNIVVYKLVTACSVCGDAGVCWPHFHFFRELRLVSGFRLGPGWGLVLLGLTGIECVCV